MSPMDTRQGAEKPPSLTSSHIVLNPNGYTTKPKQYTDIQRAHLLGEDYRVRRQGNLKLQKTSEKLKQLIITNKQHIKNLLRDCNPSDTATNSDQLTIHAEWPNHRNTGRVRILFTKANGLSQRHNNLKLEYLIQNCAAHQADITGTGLWK